jgi:PST family polysaccharide transporter
VDKLIISHFLGAGPLGSYTLAQRTVSAPVAAVGSAVGEVAFPAFSRRQDDNVALRSGFVRSSRVIALVTFPATVGLAILAAPFVSVVFGSQWDAVAPVVSVLAPIAAIQSVTFNSSQLLLAKGRSDWSYRWGMVYCVVLTVFELVGVKWGLFGTAVGFAVGVATLTPFSLMLAFHQVEMRLRDYLVALWPQFWITTVMAGFVGLALVVARAAAWGDLAALVAGTTAGVVVYGVLLLVVRPAALEDAMAALPRRRLR